MRKAWILMVSLFAVGLLAYPQAASRDARETIDCPVRSIHKVEGVTITSYWTVDEKVYAEADPNAPTDTVSVVDEETGTIVSMTCIAAFLNEVKTEGWGRTVSGKYIGWWNGTFHLGPAPLDAQGNPLIPYHTVAVDPSVIPLGAWVAIIPSPLNFACRVCGGIPFRPLLCRIFHATDTGVDGAWLDVYVGYQFALDMNETSKAYWIQGATVVWSPFKLALQKYLQCLGCPKVY